MAQMEKQIAAAQKFLSDVTALPTFVDLRRKQCHRLVALFGKSSLSVEQSAQGQQHLQRVNLAVTQLETMS